jgi:hypothetical protein
MLAADSMKPNKLKRHLETVHAECIGTTEFSHRKQNKFNQLKQSILKTTTVT